MVSRAFQRGYYRFRDTDALLDIDVCGGSPACASRDAIYTTDSFHEHELAHAHTLRAWGRSIGLLEEGEAVSLSCSSIFLDPLNQATDLDADWRDFIDVGFGGENPGLGYIAATRYFDFHHTANDLIENVSRDDIERSTLGFATAVYTIAEAEERFVC